MSKYRIAAIGSRLASQIKQFEAQVKRLEAAVAKIPCDVSSTSTSEDDADYAKFSEAVKTLNFVPEENSRNSKDYSASDGAHFLSQNKVSGAVCLYGTTGNSLRYISAYSDLKEFTDCAWAVLPDRG